MQSGEILKKRNLVTQEIEIDNKRQKTGPAMLPIAAHKS
jgi:hypothetical protein